MSCHYNQGRFLLMTSEIDAYLVISCRWSVMICAPSYQNAYVKIKPLFLTMNLTTQVDYGDVFT